MLLIVILALNTRVYANINFFDKNIGYQNNSIEHIEHVYSQDIKTIESFIFGRNYSNDSLDKRISRIETKLYGKTFQTLSLGLRMNNILKDYQNSYYWTKGNDRYCAPAKNFMQKLKEAFIGVPVGYTPQIEPSPYINTYGPSYMQGYYGSNGWRDHNIYSPSYAAAKMHILD